MDQKIGANLTNTSNKNKNIINDLFNSFSVRKLSVILAIFVFGFAISVFRPISLIFSGVWKLQQEINLFNVGTLSFGFQDSFVNIFGTAISLYFELPIGEVSLRYYSILMLLGIMAGYILALFLANKRNIATSVFDRLLVGLVLFGLIGARLFFVAFNWDRFSNNPLAIFLEINQGGLAIFGSIIVGITYLKFYTLKYKFNFYEFLDILAPSVLIGQILGRFGNFFNYEAYGQATGLYWKMFVPDGANITENLNERYFHPTFLYEIIPNIFLLIILLFFYENLTRKKSGQVFALYAIGYGTVRFITEYFRLDALKLELPFGFSIGAFEIKTILVSQITALLFLILGIIVFILRQKIRYSKNNFQEYNFNSNSGDLFIIKVIPNDKKLNL
jgi:phosphatidylglycerol---prolipoprotein diacylglyceryl transferase